MIMSALIAECRREFGDMPKSTQVARNGNGSINLFNVGYFPVIENSYTIRKGTSALTENGVSGYTIDLDNGDVLLANTPANGVQIKSDHKYAFWRDKNWMEAINQSIEALNARGFFRQVTRATGLMTISAGVYKVPAPSACVDLYELRTYNQGAYTDARFGWNYQQDSNAVLLDTALAVAYPAQISYLRNLQTYSTTSATLDILNDWKEIVKKNAGKLFYRSLAGKIAKQGNATIDEGHFSFTNLRTQANDYEVEFDKFALRKKPTRPAKAMGFAIK